MQYGMSLKESETTHDRYFSNNISKAINIVFHISLKSQLHVELMDYNS